MEGQWLFEPIFDDVLNGIKVGESYVNDQSKFQKITIISSETFGRLLVLDGKLQSTQNDEHIYHESLVHPIMLSHPNPKSVFIGGGGECATLREILRHKSVEEVVMVDIDEKCVKVCMEHLECYHENSFKDKRATLIYDDARKYIVESGKKFDVIILDLADPIEGGPTQQLYTQEFYEEVKKALNPGGCMVTQCGPGGELSMMQVFIPVRHTIESVFPNAHSYSAYIPSFADEWAFTMAFTDDSKSPLELTTSQVDKLIKERLVDGTVLKYYDGVTNTRLFSLPKAHRCAIAKTDDKSLIVTKNNTVKLPGGST